MKNIILLLFLFITTAAYSQVCWSELGNKKVILTSGDSISFANDVILASCKDSKGQIYVAGSFKDKNLKRFVAKWNGTFWSEVGVGANKLLASDTIRTLCVDDSDYIYAAGDFMNAKGFRYVAKFNGKGWSELGALQGNDAIFSICFDHKGSIYASGNFTSAGNMVVEKYSLIGGSNSWQIVGDANTFNGAVGALCSDPSGNIYATGRFTVGGYFCVKKWDGTAWSRVYNGTSELLAGRIVHAICMDSKGNIYVGGAFVKTNGICIVKKWDASTKTWDEIVNGSQSSEVNGNIRTLAVDSKDNLYVGGEFTNSNGKYYVAKWDGSVWQEIGTTASCSLNANGKIMTSCIVGDKVYVAGSFTDGNANNYVAQYSTTSSIAPTISGTLTLYPNPVTTTVIVKNTTLKPYTVSIVSLTGDVIKTVPLQMGEQSIDVSMCKPGFYFVRLIDEYGNLRVEKIAIQR